MRRFRTPDKASSGVELHERLVPSMPRLMRQEEETKPAPPAGELLRSERMCMVQMIVQHDAAQATVEELGELGSLMFVDLNEGVTSFQRNFVSEMKRCDEMERHLRFFEEQVALAGLTLSKRSWVERPGALNELQSQLEEYHNDLHQLNGCLLYTSPSPRDRQKSRMPSSA